MSNFKIGDVVQLRSGSPLMTVHGIGDYTMSAGLQDGVLCIWFDKNNRSEAVFHPAALEHYEG